MLKYSQTHVCIDIHKYVTVLTYSCDIKIKILIRDTKIRFKGKDIYTLLHILLKKKKTHQKYVQ